MLPNRKRNFREISILIENPVDFTPAPVTLRLESIPKVVAMTLSIDMRGRKVVVTGAAGGVGTAVAVLLARAGASVLLTDRPGSTVEERADDVSRATEAVGKICAAELDLADADIGPRLVDEAQQGLGGLDGVVNAGAVLRRAAFLDVTGAQLDESLAVNIRSMFLICQAAAPVMVGQGHGSFVNFTSPSAFTGGKVGAVHYATAKAGVVALTRGLATEFGRQGVRANVLCPGSTDTPMIRGSLTPEQVDAHIAAVPMGRLARPEEIAHGVVFLLSDFASFVNGAVLTIDGGGGLRP
jgi:NAD(P)-dependent dehydrogenase (short-subunit alcohol dehydrogenase family)